MSDRLPERARVVVIGAGIVGFSVAYHLTKLGRTDLVLIERRTLASGTTGHGAGLVTQLRHTRALTDISRYAAELYSNLEAETHPREVPGQDETWAAGLDLRRTTAYGRPVQRPREGGAGDEAPTARCE